jgi:hypothetical protein
MLSFFMAIAKYLQGTWWALNISGSTWAYPFVQLTHFTGLSLWIGTNLALDFRLLGLGKRSRTAAELSRAMFVWNWTGLAIAITGGFLMFSSAATKYIPNPAFEVKLGILIPLALITHIVVQYKSKVWGATHDVQPVGRFAGLLEALLWLCVVTAAVSIPNFDVH